MDNYKWIVLLSLLFSFIAYAFSFQSFSPILASIATSYNVTHSKVGLVMSVVLIPGIFFNIPLGLLLKKYKAKQVGIISLVLIILGTFMAATANSFNSILLGRLIFGIGGTFITLISYVIIAQWFTKEELGKAMGIFGINMPLQQFQNRYA
ncbi:MAG: MFS transporter [Thermoproteota archaeon]